MTVVFFIWNIQNLVLQRYFWIWFSFTFFLQKFFEIFEFLNLHKFWIFDKLDKLIQEFLRKFMLNTFTFMFSIILWTEVSFCSSILLQLFFSNSLCVLSLFLIIFAWRHLNFWSQLILVYFFIYQLIIRSATQIRFKIKFCRVLEIRQITPLKSSFAILVQFLRLYLYFDGNIIFYHIWFVTVSAVTQILRISILFNLAIKLTNFRLFWQIRLQFCSSTGLSRILIFSKGSYFSNSLRFLNTFWPFEGWDRILLDLNLILDTFLRRFHWWSQTKDLWTCTSDSNLRFWHILSLNLRFNSRSLFNFSWFCVYFYFFTTFFCVSDCTFLINSIICLFSFFRSGNFHIITSFVSLFSVFLCLFHLKQCIFLQNFYN